MTRCADSNWKAQSSSVEDGCSASAPRYMRMTSSDFSFRLWAFSVLRASTWKATLGSATRMAGTKSAFSLSRATRRWLPFGVQYTPARGETTTIGSTKRSTRLTASVRRLTWVGDTSRWYGLASTLARGSRQKTCQCSPTGSW